MKRRFDISSTRNGRITPPARHSYFLRRPAPDEQPAPEQTPSPASPPVGDVFASGVEPRLQDEVTADELAGFSHRMLESISLPDEDPLLVVTERLPSFVKLKAEHGNAVEAQKEQRRFTQKLVRASEPLLNHESIPEDEKSGLLDVGVLSVEKMMQLKMRAGNLAQRIAFLEQEIPRHLYARGEELGYPEPLCEKISDLTQAVLKAY